MKKLLTPALLSLASFALAAEPVIRVNDLGNVYQVNEDGTETNLGAPYDAITNNPALGSKIQQAAQVRLAQFKAETANQLQTATEAATAQVAAKEAEKQAAITAANEARATAIAAKEVEKVAAIAAKDKAIASLQEQVATLQARIAELEVQVAAAASVPAESTPTP